jgi:hypothetical protein
MTTLARRISLCLAAATMLACADRSAMEKRAAAQAAQRLVGTWDVRFDLERPLLLTARTGTAVRVVRGRLAFLENEWLNASYPQIETPTDYGTYDIDFTPFGFEPRNAGQPPTAVAGWLGKDSVEIILAPEQSRTAVAMRGKFAGDSIAGTWEVSISRADGGGGRFLMSRHREP